jgi:TonB family protein
MPKPVLTEEAKKKASGKVSVKVVVDENGKVVSATAQNNVALLRQLAEDAARQATFKPLTVDGITVRFTGTLTYDIH